MRVFRPTVATLGCVLWLASGAVAQGPAPAPPPAPVEAEAEVGAEADPKPEAGAETGAEAGTETGAETEAGSETGAGTETEAEAEAGAETEAVPAPVPPPVPAPVAEPVPVTTPPPAPPPPVPPPPAPPPFEPRAQEEIAPPPDTPEDWRTGFTLELGIGFGHQLTAGRGTSESAIGLAGMTFGIGGFVSPSTGLLFRATGTRVEYEGDVTRVAGVAGPVVQHWLAEVVKLEAGPGLSFARGESPGADATETGWGLILGLGFAFWQGHGHSLQLGLEYAPAVLDGLTVHNTSFSFNWQLL